MLQDSVCPLTFNIVTTDNISIDGFVVCNVAVINVNWINANSFTSYAWGDTLLANVIGWKTTHETHSVFIDNLGSAELQAARYLHIYNNSIYFRTAYAVTINAGVWHMGSIIVPVKRA
mgnify:CR=1 FL=1